MVIVKLILSKVFFGFLFLFAIFLFLSAIVPDNHSRFERYMQSIRTDETGIYSHSEVSDLQTSHTKSTEKKLEISTTVHTISNFGIWVQELFTHHNNWGLTTNEDSYIKTELMRTLPMTITLVVLTVSCILLFSLILCWLLTSKAPQWLKNTLDTALETISSIPEFLLCFVLIIIFARHLIPVYDKVFVSFPDNFEGMLRLIWYMMLPVIALSFANGSVSTLTKYLVNRVNNVRKSSYYQFLLANGTKGLYLNFIITFKEIIPLVVRFIAMKLPLIIGSSIVVERIFDIYGISGRAFHHFRVPDSGVILFIFVIVYIATALSDIFAEIFNLLTNPERKKA